MTLLICNRLDAPACCISGSSRRRPTGSRIRCRKSWSATSLAVLWYSSYNELQAAEGLRLRLAKQKQENGRSRREHDQARNLRRRQAPPATAAGTASGSSAAGVTVGSVGSMGSVGSGWGSVGSLGSVGSVGSLGSVGSMGSYSAPWGSYSGGSYSAPQLGPMPLFSFDNAIMAYAKEMDAREKGFGGGSGSSAAGGGSSAAGGGGEKVDPEVCKKLDKQAKADFPDAGMECADYRAFEGGFATGVKDVPPHGCRCTSETGACPYETCPGIEAFNTCLQPQALALGLASFSKLTISAPVLTTSCVYLNKIPPRLPIPGCDSVPGSGSCGVGSGGSAAAGSGQAAGSAATAGGAV